MGCLMNVLWLVFGGMTNCRGVYDCQFADDDYNRRHSFRYANNEDGGLALWPFGKEVRSGERSGRLSCTY